MRITVEPREWWKAWWGSARRRPVRTGLATMLVGFMGVLVVLMVLPSTPATPQSTVEAAVKGVREQDFSAVYAQLCEADRNQFSKGQLGVAVRQVLSAQDVTQFSIEGVHSAGRVREAGVEVEVVTVLGHRVVGGSTIHDQVSVVRENASWKLCLAVGGYEDSGLNVSQPLHDAAASTSEFGGSGP